MSLILDALRKSEQERRQADSLMPAPLTADAALLPHGYRQSFAVVAVLVLLAAGASGYWVLVAGREAAPIRRVESVPPPAAATPETSQAPRDVPRAPQLTVNPFVGTRRGGAAVRDLAEEARVPRSEAKAAPARSAAQVTRVAPASAPTRHGAHAAVKFLRAMPPDFQRALPELVVNIHIYAPRPADRILYINNRQFYAGDRVRDDIVVEEIVEDGAVLSYRGERFKLPRPS